MRVAYFFMSLFFSSSGGWVKKAQAPTLPRIRYMSCFDLTHAPVATAARDAATGLVSMSTRSTQHHPTTASILAAARSAGIPLRGTGNNGRSPHFPDYVPDHVLYIYHTSYRAHRDGVVLKRHLYL